MKNRALDMVLIKVMHERPIYRNYPMTRLYTDMLRNYSLATCIYESQYLRRYEACSIVSKP